MVGYSEEPCPRCGEYAVIFYCDVGAVEEICACDNKPKKIDWNEVYRNQKITMGLNPDIKLDWEK